MLFQGQCFYLFIFHQMEAYCGRKGFFHTFFFMAHKMKGKLLNEYPHWHSTGYIMQIN